MLVLPGEEGTEPIDEQGLMALSVLRAMGLPDVVGAVQVGSSSGGGVASLKARSAARKRGAMALQVQLPGDYRVLLAEGAADAQQLVRHLADVSPTPPHWRQQRPSLLLDGATFGPDPGDPSFGMLLLRCVRLCVHVTGCLEGGGVETGHNQRNVTPGQLTFRPSATC